jgi:hypothetical protein
MRNIAQNIKGKTELEMMYGQFRANLDDKLVYKEQP